MAGAVAFLLLWFAPSSARAAAQTAQSCLGSECNAADAASLLQQQHLVGGRRCSPEAGWSKCSNFDLGVDPLLSALLTSKYHCEWECKLMNVPSSYEDGSTGETEIFLRRARAEKGDNKQVWMLQGGPGLSGESLRTFLPMLGAGVSAYDVYVPDHRGVPFSTSLACHAAMQAYGEAVFQLEVTCSAEAPCLVPEQAWLNSSFAGACFQEMSQNGLVLGDFTVTNAARDVLHLMQTQAKDADTSFNIYGASYGTWWGQRILQVSSAERATRNWPKISRAVLSGVVSSEYSFDHFPLGVNYAGRKLMNYCSADPTCSTHYGSEPQAAWDALLQNVETIAQNTTSCASEFLSLLPFGVNNTRSTISFFLHFSLQFGLSVQDLGLLFQALGLGSSSSSLEGAVIQNNLIIFDFRVWALLILHRVSRCDSRDVNVATYLGPWGALLQVDPNALLGGPRQISLILREQIINTELTSTRNGGTVPSVYANETPDEVIFGYIRDSWYYNRNTSRTQPWLSEEIWPYNSSDADSYSQSPVETNASVIFISGDLDGQTPLWSAQLAHDQLIGPCKRLVTIPGWGHGAVFNTECGRDALSTFMGQSEDSCPNVLCQTIESAQMVTPGIDFAEGGGTLSAITRTLFAQTGYWGDTMTPQDSENPNVALQNESMVMTAIAMGMSQIQG